MKDRRLTIRQLMVAVIAVSLAIWSCVMWGRSTRFAKHSRFHHTLMEIAQHNLFVHEYYPAEPGTFKRFEHLSEYQEKVRALLLSEIRYEEQLYRKYRRA